MNLPLFIIIKETLMNCAKLCVIDEPMKQEKLQSLFQVCPEIIEVETEDKALLEPERGFLPPFSHGTLCMAVLIESLQKLGILQNVELHHFSIGYLANRRSEHALLEGLEYCADQNIDLVSCSVGIFQRLWATSIISFLHGQEKPLVVAAAANSERITYPAALPSVLGVKLAEEPFATPCSVINPLNGIDLLARCSESEVLDKIGYGFSNSILAPQICAQAAKLVLEGVPAEKGQILSALTNGARIQLPERPIVFGPQNPDDEPPVVLLPYSGASYTERFQQAMELQRKFEENDYSCGILSDRLQAADFETGHFPANPRNIERDISYYTRAAEHSLFLLVTERDAPCDLRFDEDEMGTDKISGLYERILSTFPDQ